MYKISRRTTLKGLGLTCLAGCTTSLPTLEQNPWAFAQNIADNTTVPTFPNKEFNLLEFGGKEGSDNTLAFKKAIAACSNAGGGKVVVPAGRFETGAIHLESNVNLHISKGATIAFFTDPKYYLPAVFTRWEGMECMGYSPLIYAYGKTNIAITGKGTLDGQADPTHWWAWKGNKEWGVEGYPSQKESRNQLFAQAEAGDPVSERVYADGHYLRPSFVQPYKCENVLIEDITIINAPFWLLHPTLSQNVTVRGVHLESLGPNSDGCDPESCKNVVIENCFFNTGDDCIAIKSGRNNDGRRLATPTENVIIRNCKMEAGHGGVVIGSEISGGVRNVFAENNVMSSPDLEKGIRIKTNSVRGGLLENIYVRNCTIGEVQQAIVINFQYEEGDAGKFDPTVRNVEIRNLVCQHALQVFNIRGFERAPIQNFRIIDSTFVRGDNPGVIEHTTGLVIDNVQVNGKAFNI